MNYKHLITLSSSTLYRTRCVKCGSSPKDGRTVCLLDIKQMKNCTFSDAKEDLEFFEEHKNMIDFYEMSNVNKCLTFNMIFNKYNPRIHSHSFDKEEHLKKIIVFCKCGYTMWRFNGNTSGLEIKNRKCKGYFHEH